MFNMDSDFPNTGPKPQAWASSPSNSALFESDKSGIRLLSEARSKSSIENLSLQSQPK